MKFPSLSKVAGMYLSVITRFPLVFVAGIFFAVFGFMTIFDFREDISMEILLTSLFAFPFLLSIALLGENLFKKLYKQLLLNILGVWFVLVLYLVFFREFSEAGDGIRCLVMNGLAWLFLLFASVIKKDQNALWKNSLAVFTGILHTFFIFAPLYIGIAALLGATDALFDINIDEDWYLGTWFLVMGLLAGPYFAGVFNQPLDNKYPKWLEILMGYVFVPLSVAYLLLLYIYTGKIVVLWEWPDGGVAGWVMGFSCLMVFTYFLTYSLKTKILAYVQSFRRIVFFALLPLQFVLFFAIGLRISEYGITEPRYYVALFGLWVLILSLYYIFSKKKDLRVSVYTLFLLVLVSVYGPLSAYTVSLNSQFNRLEETLVEYGILVDGKISKLDECDFDYDELNSIRSMMSYVVKQGKVDDFRQWFDYGDFDNWTNDYDRNSYYSFVTHLMVATGCSDGKGYYNYMDSSHYILDKECETNYRSRYCAVTVGGYDYYLPIFSFNSRREGQDFETIDIQTDEGMYFLSLKGKTVSFRGDNIGVIEIVDLKEFIDAPDGGGGDLSNRTHVLSEYRMTMFFDNAFVEGKLLINEIDILDAGNDDFDISLVDGSLWFTLK